jgi:hypothetical protein
MSMLNPHNKAFNFALMPWGGAGLLKNMPEFSGHTRYDIIQRDPLYDIGEVVTAYSDAARAHFADEDDAEGYSPDEKLIGLVRKVAWCPRGLDDEDDFSNVTDRSRTYLYFMTRIDAPQDSMTKMLVAVEEDLTDHSPQPGFQIGMFVQVPALGYLESDPDPDLRMVNIARTWWHHEMTVFHHQVVGLDLPFDENVGSGIETQMYTAGNISKHLQPRFNNDKDVQIKEPNSEDMRDDFLYRVERVWWNMIREEFTYSVKKVEDGRPVGQAEPPLRERDLMLPRSSTPEESSEGESPAQEDSEEETEE